MKYIWIGLKWNLIVNDFYWYDYLVLVYKNWVLGELNGKVVELCGYMYGCFMFEKYWNDFFCD